MDILEEYEASNPLSKEVLLSEIDEYEMYKYYMGFYPELRTGYNSPLRKGDESPSFSLFTNQYPPCEYRWKDSGLGLHGDIFKMVRILYGLTNDRDIIRKIRQDLSKEGVDNIPQIRLQERPKDRGNTIIKVKSKQWTEEAIKWWNQYHISLPTLARYNVSEVEWFSMNDRRIFPKGLCFAYPEVSEYQIYQPSNKEYKFRNNYSSKVVLGFHQLKYESDTLIITKSKKDVMALAECNIEAVAAKSESTLIPTPYLDYFDTRYKRKFELFDNDMKHNGEIYHDPKIYIPLESGCKDFSDFRKKFGHETSVKLINKLINEAR